MPSKPGNVLAIEAKSRISEKPKFTQSGDFFWTLPQRKISVTPTST
jgi:hypothetical protein